MWEAGRNVHDGCEIPFLIRGLEISTTSPVDRDGGLGIVPYVALAPVKTVLRPHRQARSSCDGDLGLSGSFNGGDFGLVAHFDADDGAELAAFGEAADEAVAEDVGEFRVLHLRYRIEGHLVGDRGGFVGHFDGDDVVEVGLVDFVFVDDGCAAGAFDGAVLYRRTGGDVERLNYVGDVVNQS